MLYFNDRCKLSINNLIIRECFIPEDGATLLSALSTSIYVTDMTHSVVKLTAHCPNVKISKQWGCDLTLRHVYMIDRLLSVLLDLVIWSSCLLWILTQKDTCIKIRIQEQRNMVKPQSPSKCVRFIPSAPVYPVRDVSGYLRHSDSFRCLLSSWI